MALPFFNSADRMSAIQNWTFHASLRYAGHSEHAIHALRDSPAKRGLDVLNPFVFLCVLCLSVIVQNGEGGCLRAQTSSSFFKAISCVLNLHMSSAHIKYSTHFLFSLSLCPLRSFVAKNLLVFS
jgi:hypothetical protein